MFKDFKKFTEAMDFEDIPDRINPDVKQKIRDDEHVYKGHKAFPKRQDKRFGEEIAANRYRELVEKLRRYTGLEDFDKMMLYQVVIAAVQKIQRIEDQHIEQLQNLAVELVTKELNVPKGSLQFDAKIKKLGQINLDGMKKKMEEDEEELQDAAEKHFEQDQEEMKRRFINGLVQGAANKGHYMFHLAEKELNEIDEELLDLYGAMITANDLNYWLWSDDEISQAGEDESSAGKVKIDMSTEPPTIRVEAINFPTLVHELVKGVMEYLSLYGLPSDREVRRKVLNRTDFLDSEMWDLRFGPQLWDKFVSAIDFNEWEIKEILYAKLMEMPASEFNSLMKELMDGTEKGKKMLKDLANEIRNDLKEEEYEEAMGKGRFDKDDLGEDDIELNDLM